MVDTAAAAAAASTGSKPLNIQTGCLLTRDR